MNNEQTTRLTSLWKDLMFSSATDKWFTPQDLYAALDAEFGFKLDPCPQNPIVNGLTIPWDVTTYVNPPYGRSIGKWIEKGYKDSLKYKCVVVMLVPARTDTKWWQQWVMEASEVRFIGGRLKFGEYPQGDFSSAVVKQNAAPFPSAIVIFNGVNRKVITRYHRANKKGEVI